MGALRGYLLRILDRLHEVAFHHMRSEENFSLECGTHVPLVYSPEE